MKMLILTAAIVLGWTAIYSNRHAKTESDIQPEYREVNVNAVPATIKAALETAYSGTKLVKAYVNEKKEYKLELSVNNQKATVYTDANGNW
ncbi:hypothetical protein CLU83_3803 [Flavobacterium sp. 1]|uniref:hypothetical protein n=1 Tax=Flavobacterium sp. 1 TaxID=2035200 RepID=UPI000C23BCC4|nr:hypothetical protein [Flavobacterium sp. 1]PJJ10392.1 hypothetical protein CLU83_3803 [Flavobacterium sp. 1]